jgi:disulfide bond formation protein DsbB
MTRFFCLLRQRGAFAAFAAGFSALSLILAYVSQYGFGLQPCILCLYQRVPHAIAVVLGLAAFFLRKTRAYPAMLALCGLTFFVGAGIAFYHVGVERGVFEMTAKCQGMIDDSKLTFEELQAALLATPHVPCDKPQFVFLSVSMAGWNMLFSLLAGGILCGAAIVLRRRRTRA